jgi:L-rhamnose mutarotase
MKKSCFKPVRYGLALRVRPEHFEAYRQAHVAVWPEVLAQMRRSNLRNYTIFHHDGMLFAHYEYWGDNYEVDMARMAEDPMTQGWWKLMRPMQEPLATRAQGEWWARMEPVFHFGG